MYLSILALAIVVAEFFYFRKQIKNMKGVSPVVAAPKQTRDTFSVLYGEL